MCVCGWEAVVPCVSGSLWCVRSREMGTSILIFHVSGGSSASPVPASSLAAFPPPPPPPSLSHSLVTCQWASDSAHNANFGASFKTLISRIDNDTETVSPRSQVQVAWVGHRTQEAGRSANGAGSGTRIRAEVDSECSRALQVLVQRMCAGRDLSLAGPSYQLDTPPTQAIHGLPALPALPALPRSTHPSICCGCASVFLVISGCIGR